MERQAPAVAGRLNQDRIAGASHCFSGHTLALLLGAQLQWQDFSEPWIGAGILLTALGRGGDDLTPESAARFPFFDADYTSIRSPILVGFGAGDHPHVTLRGPESHADAFTDAPGANALLMIAGVGHGLGGIAGLDANETEAEAPDAHEATRRLTFA